MIFVFYQYIIINMEPLWYRILFEKASRRKHTSPMGGKGYVAFEVTTSFDLKSLSVPTLSIFMI